MGEWVRAVAPGRVCFLPAASIGRSALEALCAALEQAAGMTATERSGREPVGSVRRLEEARRELLLHAGSAPEPCLVTKDAALSVASRLADAGEELEGAGLHAAALVATAVSERLLDALTETLLS